MPMVLRSLPDIVNADPRLAAYVARCTSRPAFKVGSKFSGETSSAA
jgi:hypothetical protein